MRVKIPVMREFKHPELKKVKLSEGVITKKELAELVKNTNFLIDKGLHVPGYRLTHEGQEDLREHKGKAIGWIELMELAEDGRVIGHSEFTEIGKSLIRGKDVRWVSSGIRRDFKLTGEPEGPVLPGLYLDHVAVLGDENPAVKGLVDLSRVELTEGVRVPPGTEGFSVNETNQEIAYFSEITREQKEHDMEDNKKTTDGGVTTAQFKELMDRFEVLSGNLTEEKKKTEAAEAKLKEYEKSTAEAKFAEYKTDVDKNIKAIQTKLMFGAELSEKLTAVGVSVYGTKNGEKAFKDLIDSLEKSKFAPQGRLQQKDERTAELSEDGADLTEQDIANATTDLALSKRITTIVATRQKTDPKFTFAKLQQEVRARASN